MASFREIANDSQPKRSWFPQQRMVDKVGKFRCERLIMPSADSLDRIKVQHPTRRQIARSARHMAKRLLRFPKYLRQTMPLRFPKLVECSVCGWQGRQFADNLWHEACQCPKCQADVRHRLLMAAFDQLPAIAFDKVIRGKSVYILLRNGRSRNACGNRRGVIFPQICITCVGIFKSTSVEWIRLPTPNSTQSLHVTY